MQQIHGTWDLMYNRLEVADEGLKPRQFVAVMLSRLPMSYGTLINVIESYPKDQITVDFVKNKLRDEWRRRQECYDFQSGPSDEKALKIGTSIKALPKMKKRGVCHFCQEEGHFIRDCPLMADVRKDFCMKNNRRGARANLVKEVHPKKEMCHISM